MQILHLPEAAGEFAVQPVENFLRARNHFVHPDERFERRTIQRVNGQIPWTEFFQFQLAAPFRLQFAHDRHHVLFHRVVKLFAILRRVVETAGPAECVVAIVFKSCALRDLRAELQHLVENPVELFRLLQTAPGYQLPCPLPQGTVRFLEVTAHLDERLFLAAKIHRERTAQFLILLG